MFSDDESNFEVFNHRSRVTKWLRFNLVCISYKGTSYVTFIQDESINLSTSIPWKAIFYHLLNYYVSQMTLGFLNKMVLRYIPLTQ
ncbi:hypothetical protein BpHYR1_021822 [Brachionus plicatilis]|uniref:Uncharacterized protein n=1 Tax=Brachionus plicatilis TaxID=10195 RepID=A0A3M7T3V7_BRAPC|nr:hypothetical protein BpHYR1_021822 [Brachionus plicatilis]